MKKYIVFFYSIVFSAALVQAVDIWRHPEPAEQNSFFVGVFSPSVSFTSGFALLPPEFNFDYLLPVFLPVSLGAYAKSPSPNLKSFGLRAAYHINLDSQKTDLYFLYVFDFGFIRNDLLEKYNDEKQEIHFYDFRAGIRRVFNNYLCIFLETDFKFHGINIGISLKLI